MSFVGCLNYYCRLIPKLSALLSPITKAISLGKKFKLTEKMLENIEILKNNIKNGIGVCHLVYPANDDEFERIFVAADTSLHQTGSIIGNLRLENDEISNIRVCGYASKALVEQETLLSARARELIGLSHGIKAFRELLPEDARLIFIVDHKSLDSIIDKPALKTSGGTRVRGAYASILEYPLCRIIYLPNTSEIIKIVDNLSRHPIEELNKEIFRPSFDKSSLGQFNNMELNIPRQVVYVNAIKDAQKACDHISKIKKTLLEKPRLVNSEYSLVNDIIYKRVRNGKLLAVIPQRLSRDIINYFHVTLHHCGEKMLLQHLKSEPILLQGKLKNVAQCIKSCITCALVHKRYGTEGVEASIEPTLSPYAAMYADLVVWNLSEYDKQYLFLTFLDGFSRRLTVRHVKSKKAQHMIPAITELIMEAGAIGQAHLITDNGKEFVSKEFEECLTMLAVSHSTISPRNSSGNKIERSHRELRSILRAYDLNPTNIVHKFYCAAHILNMRPSEGLSNLSPLQVLFNKNPPSYFGHLSLKQSDLENTTVENFEEHREHIQALHAVQAQKQLTKFFLKSNVSNGNLKENDMVILRDPSNNAFHASSQRGPWKVTRVKTRNNFEIKHIFNNNKLLRNGKFLVKYNADSTDSNYIRDSENIFLNAKTREIINSKQPIIQKVISPLAIDYSHLKIAEDKDESRYSLRSRK
jgi:hypothetical protein